MRCSEMNFGKLLGDMSEPGLRFLSVRFCATRLRRGSPYLSSR